MNARPRLEPSPSPDAGLIRHAAVLQRFSQAWARGDVDALMDLMSDNPTYRSSTGPGPGATHHGRDAVRAAFTRMVSAPPPADAPTVPAAPTNGPPGEVVFFGNRALSFWSLPGRNPDGSPAVVEGVDVMTFDDQGRIAVKDAYRKAWSEAPPAKRTG